MIDDVLSGQYYIHKRSAWIRTQQRWIPYPYQRHLAYLPLRLRLACVWDLVKSRIVKKKAANFKEWIISHFGESIASCFMLPYNFKVWAYPVEMLGVNWLEERVAPLALSNLVSALFGLRYSLSSWGDNAVFKFPQQGGTGEIFRRIASSLKDFIHYGHELKAVDTRKKILFFSGQKEDNYDILINTSPLDKLVEMLVDCPPILSSAARQLRHNSLFVVGLGFNRPNQAKRCWVYFPDEDVPFFRVTHFSNYSPYNVADISRQHSLICETSHSCYRPLDKDKILNMTIQGLIDTGIIEKGDVDSIGSTFLFDVDYAYPIPTLGRDAALARIQPQLERMQIYSRGRFGAWRYEIGNTDHSLMQGKEVVDMILGIGKETVWRS